MKVTIQHDPRRKTLLATLKESCYRQFPEAEISVFRCAGNPMETFLAAIAAADGGLFLEDDAELSSNLRFDPFDERPMITQFFTRRKAGTAGLRPGSSWLCNVGFYVPAGLGVEIAKFGESWPRIHEHPTGFDLIVRDFLVAAKIKYHQAFPALVNHRVGKSLLGPRAKDRSAPSFHQ